MTKRYPMDFIHSTPHIVVPDGPAAIEFYKKSVRRAGTRAAHDTRW